MSIYKIFLSTTFMFVSFIAMAQDVVVPEKVDGYTWILNNIFLIATVFISFAAVFTVTNVISKLLQLRKLEILDAKEVSKEEALALVNQSSIAAAYDWAWGLVPIKDEASIDLGHEYDNIRELDNRLPPWWLALMYGSMIFAAVYMYAYQFSGSDWSSEKEYNNEILAAEISKKAYLDKSTNSVDESNVIELVDENLIAEGAQLYIDNCVACHGQKGEGVTGLGPNFCDAYWVHGGGVKNIFKTIKNGVPEKGMIAWSSQLRPFEMQKLASYIMTLEGTNPPNQKEAEGEIYIKEMAKDSIVNSANG